MLLLIHHPCLYWLQYAKVIIICLKRKQINSLFEYWNKKIGERLNGVVHLQSPSNNFCNLLHIPFVVKDLRLWLGLQVEIALLFFTLLKRPHVTVGETSKLFQLFVHHGAGQIRTTYFFWIDSESLIAKRNFRKNCF